MSIDQLSLTVWGCGAPVVNHQTPWPESTGVCGMRQHLAGVITGATGSGETTWIFCFNLV